MNRDDLRRLRDHMAKVGCEALIYAASRNPFQATFIPTNAGWIVRHLCGQVRLGRGPDLVDFGWRQGLRSGLCN